MIVDIFGGARGAALGIKRVFPDEYVLGIDNDLDCARTSAAAGLPFLCADVESYPIWPFKDQVTGLWASPPCTDFSQAGKRSGIYGETGRLIWDAHLWASKLWPDWFVFEQVPDVQPYWRAFAKDFTERGYSTWTGVLNCADYGVPQTRQRAILIASRVASVTCPPPTHAKSPHPVMFGAEELPWVSMAEALGWESDDEMAYVRGAGATERHGSRPARAADEPAPTITGAGAGAGGGAKFRHILNTRRDQREDGSTQTRESSAPAPALTAKAGGQWIWERPATTVQGDRRIAPPGHDDRAGGEAQFTDGTILVTLEELARLQDFPAGYPFQGGKGSIARQIGNAVPPTLAEVCVRMAAGR